MPDPASAGGVFPDRALFSDENRPTTRCVKPGGADAYSAGRQSTIRSRKGHDSRTSAWSSTSHPTGFVASGQLPAADDRDHQPQAHEARQHIADNPQAPRRNTEHARGRRGRQHPRAADNDRRGDDRETQPVAGPVDLVGQGIQVLMANVDLPFAAGHPPRDIAELAGKALEEIQQVPAGHGGRFEQAALCHPIGPQLQQTRLDQH